VLVLLDGRANQQLSVSPFRRRQIECSDVVHGQEVHILERFLSL